MSRLNKATRGKVKRPYGIVVYGTDGVGKTTFASKAPNPIYFGNERGSNNLDVTRLTQGSWKDLRLDVKALITDAHDHGTLVIDSLDWAEPLLHKHVADAHGVKSIELAAGGYGKGYGEASGEWRDLRDDLDTLRDQRSMHVILIGHCKTVDFNDPQTQANYNRYQLKLRDADSAMWREWGDAVLFANYETFTKDVGGKTRAFGNGGRTVHTDRRAGYDAKNRLGLPETIPFEWDDFIALAEAGKPGEPDAIAERINGLLSQMMDVEQRKKIAEYVAANRQDAVKLTAAEDRVKALLGMAAQS